MTPKDKITIKADWSMTKHNNRVTIVGATYRQALSYLCSLKRHYGLGDFAPKPIFVQSIVDELEPYWMEFAPCKDGKKIEPEDCMVCPYLHDCEQFD